MNLTNLSVRNLHAYRCSYPQHEIDDRKDQIRGDLTRISPDVRVMDFVQKAAFKGGLSNSTFCVRERIDAMSQCVLTTYVAERFRTCDLAIGSFGLGFDEVMKLAESVDIRKVRIVFLDILVVWFCLGPMTTCK